ncbi:MAG: type I methionyl aminopeptidase [Candidatus Saganbacteria bacterium]|nr:type I methionyl aminopeptidase [Candidatus Saganbacteria bacterium]
MIPIKSEEEIAKINKGGKILAEIFREIGKLIQPGIDTAEIDKGTEALILKKGVIPAFKGYRGYKHVSCISVNDEIVHGIPGRRCLQEGDIVGVDVGVIVEDYYADMAQTYPVGKVSKKAKKLIAATKQALRTAIKQARTGNHLGDIGAAVDAYAKRAGFVVVRDLFGHGVGKALHEDPLIPNYGNWGEGIELKSGMVFAIEPMLNEGSHEIKTLDDGWTIVTVDHGLSAHFEHTIVIKEGAAEVLTSV